MSRYDLESALSNFIDDRIQNTEYFASEDHEHSQDDTFEDKVEQYLGDNFSVGTGCRVQRAFEQSVRAIVNAHLDSDTHADANVRILLRSILTNARKLPAQKATSVLASCDAALLMMIESIEVPSVSNGAVPADV